MKPQTKSRHDPAKYKKWYDANKHKKIAYQKIRYSMNPKKFIAQAKKYRDERPGCWRKSHLKRHYGIDSFEFDRLLILQNNKCAICLREFDRSSKKLKPNIDHDHKTGKVRGLLCHHCNIALGHVEAENFLPAALKYLGLS